MGIKFLCPNGHKLHVKVFLSGKKAICPKCGARVVVPAADPSTVADEGPGLTAGDSSIEVEDSAVAARQATLAAAGQSGVHATTMAAALPASGSSPATSSDPIEDAPSAVWYVRPATGGQFGPASGEIMRAWISEGRVGASSLVWRAGWSEWRAAAGIFPQLGALLATPGVSVGPPTLVATAGQSTNHANGARPSSAAELPVGHVAQTVAASVAPQGGPPASTTVPPLAQGMRKKRRNRDLSLIASAILLVISIILVAVLIMVWRSQSSPSDNSSKEPEQASETSTRQNSSSAHAIG
jgi:hypothetical protein